MRMTSGRALALVALGAGTLTALWSVRGEAALPPQYDRWNEFAAVLSDVVMPGGMSGRQLADAARHVLRRLNLPADVYPVSVHLMYQLRPSPPPGALASTIDPMIPPKSYVVGTFHVDSASEVRP